MTEENKSPRFSAVKYDEISMALSAAFKAKFEDIEHALQTHLQNDREFNVAMTHLEIAHTFIGKAIRNGQVRRIGDSK